MPRIRTIKPEFWTDSLMVQLPHLTRLIYIALWNLADDHGYIRDEPERVAMEIMPREKPSDVDASLQLLAACGRLEWFVSEDGASYYRVAHWDDHQRVDHPAKSKVSREDSRKLAIPLSVRREVAVKYGCDPGETKPACCYYCGSEGSVHWFRLNNGLPSSWVVFPQLELDHLEAEAEGGENTNKNIVLACRSCNRSKGTAHWFDFFSSRALASPREPSGALALERKGKERKGSEEEPRKVAAPTDDHRALATELGLDCNAEWDSFRDYCQAKGRRYKDTGAAFRNWLRQAKRYAVRDGTAPSAKRVAEKRVAL